MYVVYCLTSYCGLILMQENGHTSQQAGDSSNNMSFLESELRKKGLCLIPTSMLLNYLSTNI